MSFGFSVGDFLAVIELANKVRRDFLTAPEAYQAIAAEVKTFSLILQDIDVYLPSHSVSEAQQKEFDNVKASSLKTLVDIEKAIAKFSKLDSQASGLRQQARRIWQRVKWEPEDIRDLRLRIVSTTTLLNTLADDFNRQNVAAIAINTSKLVQKANQQADQKILDWLATPEYAAKHDNHRQQRLAGTGEWLLETAIFRAWVGSTASGGQSDIVEQNNLDPVSQTSNVILLQGVPGIGKTLLASMCIDYLEKTHGQEKDIAICYYYCDYNRQKDQNPEYILASLLRQLIQQLNTNAPEKLVNSFNSHQKLGTRPTLPENREALRLTARTFRTIYVVLDALDECQSADGSRRTVISELLAFAKTTSSRILFTSRPLPDITNFFANNELMEIRASSPDIARLAKARISSLPSFVARSTDLQHEIEQAIVTAADGVFLLAALYLQALQGSRSPRAVRSALESFSKGSSGYTDAYVNTMKRISSQVKDQKELAIDALMWATFAERTLTSKELLHALATLPEEPTFSEDNIPDIEDVVSACCGLLTVETDTGLLRLVHRTTQEYLKDNRSIWFNQPQTKMSKICDAYLSYVANQVQDNHAKDETKKQSDHLVFYNYASWHGVQHAQMRENPMTMQELVASEKRFEASTKAYPDHVASKYLDLSLQNPGLTGLHLLAYYGVNDLIPHFLERYNINAVDKFQRTPIVYAVQRNHIRTMKLLIRNGAQLNVLDGLGHSPLHEAIFHQTKNIEKYFLARSGLTRRASGRAVRNKRMAKIIKKITEDATKLLLHHGANPLLADNTGRTPLSYAAAMAHKDYLELILKGAFKWLGLEQHSGMVISPEHRMLIHKPDAEGCAPIMYAARPLAGIENRVALLLDYGADANSYDGKERSVLSWIAESNSDDNSGEIAILQRILDEGAQVNREDTDGGTPLFYAAGAYGSTKAMKLLLDYGAVIDHPERTSGLTPLLYAVQSEIQENVKLLLDHGADINHQGPDGATALSMAMLGSLTDIAEILLHNAANPNVANQFGQTPLHIAAMMDDTELFDDLLAANADVNARDVRGMSILEYASTSGDMKILKQVLNLVQFVPLPNFETLTWTALHRTCLQGSFDMLLSLVKLGANATVVETKEPAAKWTPLDLAMYWANTNLVTSQGTLIQDHPWAELVDSGIVQLDRQTQAISAFRSNELGPTDPHDGFHCDVCGASLSGLRFNCLKCEDFDLCLLCYTDAERVHPGHPLKALKPGETNDNADYDDDRNEDHDDDADDDDDTNEDFDDEEDDDSEDEGDEKKEY